MIFQMQNTIAKSTLLPANTKRPLCHGEYGISIGMVDNEQMEIILRRESRIYSFKKQTISMIRKYYYNNIIC